MSADPFEEMLYGSTPDGMQFGVPIISQIDDTLYMGGYSETAVLPTYIRHVISLYGTATLPARHWVDSFMGVQMFDAPSQDLGKVDAIARWVNDCCEEGPTFVHCQYGINRSGVVVARALMQRGYSADEAIDRLRHKRSKAVLFRTEFTDWLREMPAADITPVADFLDVPLWDGDDAA